MNNILCTNCKSSHIQQNDTEYSCLECGTVIDAIEYTNEIISNTTQDISTERNKYSIKIKENYKQLNTLCEILQINKEQKLKAKNYFKTLNDYDNSWPCGLNGRLRSLACIYFSVKHKKPLSLKKMALEGQVNLGKLGSVINQCGLILKETYNNDTNDNFFSCNTTILSNDTSMLLAKPNSPFLYVEKCISSLTPVITSEKRYDIVKRCKVIISIAMDNFIADGRNPLGITAAAIIFTLETYKMNEYITNEGKINICNNLEISLNTAMQRYKEIQKLLILKAKNYLPYDINEKNIANNYCEIAEIFQSEIDENNNTTNTSNQSTNTSNHNITKQSHIISNPPSFIAVSNARNERLKKINRAKERIQNTLSHNKNTSLSNSTHNSTWDNEDLVIENLLLQGVKEEIILEGYYSSEYSSQLKNIKHDIDSEKLNDADATEEELERYISGYKRELPESLQELPRTKKQKTI